MKRLAVLLAVSSKQFTGNGPLVQMCSGDPRAGQMWGEGLKLNGNPSYAGQPLGAAR